MKSFFLALVSLVLFSLNTKAQDYTAADAQSDLENGIVSYVNSIKKVIEPQNSFDDFKIKLIGPSNVKTITKEGNDLLLTAYNLIISNATESKIKEQGLSPFAKAFSVVLAYEDANGFSGPYLDNGSIYLYGGDSQGLLNYKAEADDCGKIRVCAHWYSIGCHAHNVVVWICNHRETIALMIKLFEVF